MDLTGWRLQYPVGGKDSCVDCVGTITMTEQMISCCQMVK